MSEVTPFNFEGQGVRWVRIDGESWAVASDVCKALKIADTRQAVERLDEADWCQVPISSGGQDRWMYVVNESGLYEMIIRSDKPDARRFRHWVTREVLPTIRKTGSYQVVPVEPGDDLAVLEGMIRNIREQRNRTAVLEAKVAAIEGAHDEFTTLAYAKLNGLPTDRVSCQRHGQRASRLMRARRTEPRKRQDATFGTVNVYPVSVLEETAE
jgi:anti-repressor protein